MAEDKKGFVLYADQKLIFNDLTNEEAGILIKHIFSYVNDESPVLEDRFIDMAFKPIKLQLKRDLVKYQSVKERNSANARKRWDAVASSGIPKDTKNADKGNDTVKGNDIVNDTDNVILKENFRLNDQVIRIPVSEYFKQNFPGFREQWIMKNGTLLEKSVYEKMDTDYFGYTFTDINHIQNTFKAVWKKLSENGTKQIINTKPGKALNPSKP